MLHHTRRWNRSHGEELRSAWLNGVGMLVWENVFGVVGRLERARPRAAARRCVDVQRRCVALLTRRRVDAARGAQRRTSQVVGSRWRHGDDELWALANRADEPFAGEVALGGRRAADLAAAARARSRHRRRGVAVVRRAASTGVPGARDGARSRRRWLASPRVPDGFVAVEPRAVAIARVPPARDGRLRRGAVRRGVEAAAAAPARLRRGRARRRRAARFAIARREVAGRRDR